MTYKSHRASTLCGIFFHRKGGNMTTNSIFFRTLSFCWLKLGLGVLNIIIDAVLLGILLGIGVLFNSEGVFAIMLMVWLGCIGLVNFLMNHYLGYMVKAGHVAVIAESFRTGEIPTAPITSGDRKSHV